MPYSYFVSVCVFLSRIIWKQLILLQMPLNWSFWKFALGLQIPFSQVEMISDLSKRLHCNISEGSYLKFWLPINLVDGVNANNACPYIQVDNHINHPSLTQCHLFIVLQTRQPNSIQWQQMHQLELITRDPGSHFERSNLLWSVNRVINGSVNGLLPDRRQDIIWTNPESLSIGPPSNKP